MIRDGDMVNTTNGEGVVIFQFTYDVPIVEVRFADKNTKLFPLSEVTFLSTLRTD